MNPLYKIPQPRACKSFFKKCYTSQDRARQSMEFIYRFKPVEFNSMVEMFCLECDRWHIKFLPRARYSSAAYKKSDAHKFRLIIEEQRQALTARPKPKKLSRIY